ncbi:MAG: flagellar biosynthetic protein FliO [Rhizobium sp.]|nr:flagellar biosynthetic protein FliO [Rhizobium sp.]
MFDGLTPDLAPRLVLAIGGVGIAFVVLILVLIILKRRNSPLFIKGGKSREPRLLVLDAAAVDPKRRLVLIRRDDVEHLIMIGGPTDIVIESGITDRSRAVPPARAHTTEDASSILPSLASPVEARPTPIAAERRAEAARPVAAAPAERAVAPAADARSTTVAVPAATQPAVRSAPPAVEVARRPEPAIERTIERTATARQPENKDVSAMGAVLYGEDREPMTGGRPTAPAAGTQTVQPVPRRIETIEPVPGHARPEPGQSAAEAILDAARSRVLQNHPSTTSTAALPASERSVAPPMESARRVQSAQPAASALPATSQSPQRNLPQVEASRPTDVEPSDFEKLLEAELDANGVFGSQSPQVRGDTRVTNAAPANAAAPPVRVAPPISGATADVTSEAEVARLLGEIAINRKP